jgi:RNA-directed DNA polymerase
VIYEDSACRIAGGDMLIRPSKLWLHGRSKRLGEPGQGRQAGVPRGGVVGPMLANLYMNRFLKHSRKARKRSERVVNYVDDLVILSGGPCGQVHACRRRVR